MPPEKTIGSLTITFFKVRLLRSFNNDSLGSFLLSTLESNIMNDANEKSWGGFPRYYGATVEEATRAVEMGDDAVSQRWAEELEESSPGIRDSIEFAAKQWNTVLRDHLRSETGLRISAVGNSKAVPVKIVGGMPVSFAEAMRGFDGLEWLLLHRPAVEAVASGTLFMKRHTGAVRAAWGNSAGPSDARDIENVHETALAWLRKLEQAPTIDRIFEIREDVLGAYYFRIPEIRLYWIVIGIVARSIGVSVEALTIVVLAHELAHAYTHLGLDIDNERWDTGRFAQTDLYVVEGLAQFYTQVVCKRIGYRMPEALDAYQVLLSKQSGPYLAHLDWVQNHEHGGEIVRISMIECRSRGIKASEEFADTVRRHRMGIRG